MKGHFNSIQATFSNMNIKSMERHNGFITSMLKKGNHPLGVLLL